MAKTQTKPPATKRSSQKWVRNAIDELALAQGCVFDESLGIFVIDWSAKYLRLYEGEHAGEPLIMRDWQYEATMRMFSWVMWSDRYQRWIRRFRSASFWVPKKNKKSPTIAAWGLYLLTADGEMGQKVYFCAKDGLQAKEIAGKHAAEMVRKSEDLSDECRIYQNTGQIEHLPTKSILKPLSSSDDRSKKSKEGLNGSTITDETHVVDRDFKNIISRAGISRSEPLDIEASTAGDNPAGYGKERWDYGEAVNKGEIKNIRHLHLSYHAPQDLSDAALAADPLKYGQLANPAWGHTIDPQEFIADYRGSTRSGSELALFKMYRLNIWQGSSQPWLDLNAWNGGSVSGETLLDEFRGRECWAGLDLAKTTDTSAFVLCFPPEEFEGTYTFLSWFFLPRAKAQEMNDRVPYLKWEEEGAITLTDGNVTDYETIKAKILELRDHFEIRELHYDPWNAMHLCQELTKEGVDCVEFGLTTKNMAEPTKELERLTLAGRIAHSNNPCMNWQVSVANVRTDHSGNLRIVKPKHGDYRKVDGPVAAVMALAGALQRTGNGPGYYDDPDNELEMG